MEPMTMHSERNLVSFATTRPSRTHQVLSDARDLEMRRTSEKAWFEQIGISSETLKAFGGDKTGSPTGSKAPHELDDYIEDFGGGGF